jgi:hypothetical protein
MQWNKNYPDKDILKNEVVSMAEIHRDVLLENIPNSEIRGIYFKGSGNKEWQTPLDYVPELSDVDIHIHFYDDGAMDKYLRNYEIVMKINKEIEGNFLLKFLNPLHYPRPQLIPVNKMLQEIEYVPSAKGMVTDLYGETYSYSDQIDGELTRKIAKENLIGLADFLYKFPLHIIDRPAKYLGQGLRALIWRVSPTAPRVADIYGIDYNTSWAMNRTDLIRLLRELNEEQLAENYRDFYALAWKFFLSEYTDYTAARQAIWAGINVLKRGVAIAKKVH